MPTFYCLLGNTPQLSLLELRSVLGTSQVKHVSPQVAEVELAETQLGQLMTVVGGVIKICQPLQELASSQPEAIERDMSQYLASLGQAKVSFGVAELQRDHHQPLSLSEIKKQLHDLGVSARYLEAPRTGLSASVLLHQSEVIELVVVPVDSTWWLAKTVEVQNIDAWTQRDRHKPYADRRKGMLPPKVARMMVNVALGQLSDSNPAVTLGQAEDYRLYDPFCGTGTVLIEAVVRGCQVVGSDLDADAVAGTQKNLDWLSQVTRQSLKAQVFPADVSRVSLGQIGTRVSAIVTEPFLGKVTPRAEQLPGIFKGLGKLYLGAFKRWTELLQPGGVVVMIFPYVQLGNRVFSLENLIDKLGSLGYTIVSEPVLYHRPQAVVQRQILIFRYQ